MLSSHSQRPRSGQTQTTYQEPEDRAHLYPELLALLADALSEVITAAAQLVETATLVP